MEDLRNSQFINSMIIFSHTDESNELMKQIKEAVEEVKKKGYDENSK